MVRALVCLVFFFSSPAFAQETPDVVRRTDGALFRGVIVESVPDEYVLLRTVTGDLRRFEATELAYSGPASGDPSASTATTAAASDEVSSGDPSASTATTAAASDEVSSGDPSASTATTAAASGEVSERTAPPRPRRNAEIRPNLRVLSDPPGLALRLENGSAMGIVGEVPVAVRTYRTVCTAPCTAYVAEGLQFGSVLDERGRERRLRRPIDIRSGQTLRISVPSRRTARIAAWLSVIGGLAIGIPLFAYSFSNREVDGFDRGPPSLGPLIIGSTLIAFSYSMIFGAAYGLRDKPRVEIVSGPGATRRR